jgi:plasmid stabilization system protein ParE
VARITWSREALRDLSRFHDFLLEKNPRAAADAVAAIRESVGMLEKFPAAGRMTATGDPSIREWVVPFRNAGYVLRYEVDGAKITIAAIRHMREGRF